MILENYISGYLLKENAVSRPEDYPSKTVLLLSQNPLVHQGETDRAHSVTPCRLKIHLLFVPPAHIKPQNLILASSLLFFLLQDSMTQLVKILSILKSEDLYTTEEHVSNSDCAYIIT